MSYFAFRVTKGALVTFLCPAGVSGPVCRVFDFGSCRR